MNNEPMTTTISQMRALVECSDIHEIPSRQIRSALAELERLHTRLRYWENDVKYKAPEQLSGWIPYMFADLKKGTQ